MIPYETLLEKEQTFVATKLQLEAYDIDAEVEKRLADEKAKIKAAVIAERDADITKCNHYLEVIQMLKNEAIVNEQTSSEQTSNIVDSQIEFGEDKEVEYVS